MLLLIKICCLEQTWQTMMISGTSMSGKILNNPKPILPTDAS